MGWVDILAEYPLSPGSVRGLFGTISTVAREEGVASLWKGLEPGAFREHATIATTALYRLIYLPCPLSQGCIASASSADSALACMSRYVSLIGSDHCQLIQMVHSHAHYLLACVADTHFM